MDSVVSPLIYGCYLFCIYVNFDISCDRVLSKLVTEQIVLGLNQIFIYIQVMMLRCLVFSCAYFSLHEFSWFI